MVENPHSNDLHTERPGTQPPGSHPEVTSPEALLPRLGDYLVEQNLITTGELESALAHQKKSQVAGKPILLGQALLELDLIDQSDLDRAVVHQLTNLHFALQQSHRQLENRVQQRTQDLALRLQQIRAAAEITQMAVSASSLTELYQRSVDLIVERFGYFSAAIYLADGSHRYLQLAEAAGPFASVLRQRRPKILVGSRSMIGWAAANNRPRLVADVSKDFLGSEPGREDAAEAGEQGVSATLAETRSQAVVPITVQLETAQDIAAKDSGDTLTDRFYFHRQAAEAMLAQSRVLGVLDVQSEMEGAFDSDVVAVFQTIASHIASMIHNARLLESARISLTETMVLYRAGQEFSRAHTTSDVYRSLWNALADLSRDSNFPSLLLVPGAIARQTGDLGGTRPPEATANRVLRIYAPVSSPEVPDTGGEEALLSAKFTTALVDALIPPAASTSSPMSASPFLILDTSQPTSYAAPLTALAIRLGRRTVALVPVRSVIGGHLRLTALIATGLSQSAQTAEEPAAQPLDYLIQTCVSLAELSAGAFIRVAAADVMEKRLAALQSLNTISTFISARMDLNEMYKAIHGEVTRIMGEVNFLIAIYNPATNYIEVPYLHETGMENVVMIPPFPLGEGLTSILINTRQPLLIVENTEERARQLGAMTVGRSSKSWLGVPLLMAGDVYGAMIVQDVEREHRFDEDDQRLMVTLASQVAIAIRTARLLESVTHQAERQELLNRITTRIRSSNDMQTILDVTASELRRALGRSGVARVSAGIDVPDPASPTSDTPPSSPEA